MNDAHKVAALFEGDDDAAMPGHVVVIQRWYPPNAPGNTHYLRICRLKDLTTGSEFVSSTDGFSLASLPKEVAFEARVVGPVMHPNIPDAITFYLDLNDEAFAVFTANQTAEPNPFL